MRSNAQQYAALAQVKVARTSPVSRFQSFSLLSADAETVRCPFAVTATALTPLVWPVRVRSSRPVARFHTFSVRSADAETARCPSGVTAASLTRALSGR